MKTFTKISALLTLAVVAVSGSTLLADDAPPAAPAAPPSSSDTAKPDSHRSRRLERRMQYLEENLKLSDDQKTQIEAIWKQAEGKIQDTRNAAADDRRANRQKVREIMQGVHQQVRALLTPDQQKTFDTLAPQARKPKKDGSQV